MNKKPLPKKKRCKIGFFQAYHPPTTYISKQDLLKFLDEIDTETGALSGTSLRMGRMKVTKLIRDEISKCERP